MAMRTEMGTGRFVEMHTGFNDHCSRAWKLAWSLVPDPIVYLEELTRQRSSAHFQSLGAQRSS